MTARLRLLPALLLAATATALSGCGGRNLDDIALAPGGICGVLHLIACVWAILQIFQSRASTGMKLLWAALVFFAPVIGLIFWYFAGPRER